MPYLKVYDGQEKIQSLELTGEVVSIGRDASNALTLPDPSVSRHHAQVEPKGNFYVIRDNGSTNGTFVNEMLVRLQLLTQGDSIRVGKYVVRVELERTSDDESTRVRVEKIRLPSGVEDTAESSDTDSSDDRSADERLTRLRSVLSEIGYVDTVDGLLGRALELTLEELEAHRGAILRPDDRAGEDGEPSGLSPAVYRSSEDEDAATGEDFVVPEELIETALLRGVALDAVAPHYGSETNVPCLAVPLRDRTETHGVLFVARNAEAEPFSPASLCTANLLASRIAISLTNAELFAEVTHIKEQMKAIFANLVDGVVVTDTNFQVVEANAASTALLQVRDTNLLGRSFLELLETHRLRPSLSAIETAVAREGGVFEVQIESETERDEERDEPGRRVLAGVINPFPSARDPQGFVITLRDRSQAWHLERIKTVFIENVSHKLRTPLTVLTATLDLLDIEGEPPDQQTFLGLKESARTLTTLVDKFSEFSALSPRDAYDVTAVDQVDLCALTHDLARSLEELAASRDVEFHLDLPAGLPSIDCRGDGINQALFDLLENGVKFASSPGRVEVRARESGGFIQIEIVDDGPGIPSDQLESIFDVGYQVDADRTGQVPGAGLGLVIARHVIQEHGGHVRLRPAEKGTRVVVHLPCPPDHVPRDLDLVEDEADDLGSEETQMIALEEAEH